MRTPWTAAAAGTGFLVWAQNSSPTTGFVAGPFSRIQRSCLRESCGASGSRRGWDWGAATESTRQERAEALGASSEGASRHEENVVYAQDVLDRAWRSERRTNGGQTNGDFGRRLRDALTGRRGALFEEDRAYMEGILNNVVRVYCTHNLPSWSMPWQRLRQDHSTSTGFVIDNRRIITNAHSVEYSSVIQVRGRGSDRKYKAKILAVGEECDLAILTVEDDTFWEGTEPLVFGELPELTDGVNVIGYPIGGECISITAGVVSRVEMTLYAQAGMELLSIQIDAAINPGNSGGPVVNINGEVVGVAFQSMEGNDVENIGYVVPINVLEHFLEDVGRHGGEYRGFPRMGTGLQHLESPALRGSLHMKGDQTGILVTDIEPTAPAAGFIRKGDVIMEVDGIRVANDGSIPFRAGERVALRYYFSQLFPGDRVKLELLRDSKVIATTVPLFIPQYLCPVHFTGQPPSYCVLGGLVFTILSDPYIEADIDDGGLTHLLSLAHYGKKKTANEQVVVLTQVLAHEVNLGYEGMSNLHLLSFNREKILNLEHLCRMADTCKSEFMRFDFYPDRVVVLCTRDVQNATGVICTSNSIPSPRSADLVEAVKAATGGVGSNNTAEAEQQEGQGEGGGAGNDLKDGEAEAGMEGKGPNRAGREEWQEVSVRRTKIEEERAMTAGGGTPVTTRRRGGTLGWAGAPLKWLKKRA